MKKAGATVLLVLALQAGAFAAAGKWTPEQVLEHDPERLRELGLALPPAALWSPGGAGLLEAAVRIDGCSAAFVSAEGLLLTNHHCALRILQQHSKPEQDLITHGFLAKTRAEELASQATRAVVPHRATDVTAAVEAAVPEGANDLERFRAMERKRKELVAACEARPGRRCEAANFDDGVRAVLYESLELPDVRLVYAPPTAVGNYGGEVDNWSWPRHTGDFALLRVWAGADGGPASAGQGTAPYRPRHHFPVSAKGVAPGDFVMVAGYPGRTYRNLLAAEMGERAELYFPRRAALYGRWIEIMEAATAREEAARFALFDRIRTLANREKNARGQVAGIARGRLLEKKRAAEEEVVAWAKPRPERRDALAARDELAALFAARLAAWERDFLLDQAKSGPKPLDLALTLARWAGERAKPDLEREAGYQERDRPLLLERLRADQKRLHPATEEALLADLLERFAALPEGSRVAAVEELLAGRRDPESVRAAAGRLLAGTRVTGLDERMKMAEETTEQLAARRDPLLAFALALDRDLRAWKERDDTYQGAASRLRPRWLRAVAAHAEGPVEHDANGTLRLTFGQVRGYRPRDGVLYEPRTTVAGMLAKHTGEAPFDLPEVLRRAAPGAPGSRWADPELGDVPLGFLADADTTGGNSGSPVLNARGEVVGVNFDRVWENVANDFGYNPEVARNISTDLRFLFWALEAQHGEAARGLLGELGVGR